MEYIFVACLLGFVPNSYSELTRKTASACYGSDGECNLVLMKCRNGTFIHISSAQYLFTKTQSCKTLTGCEKKQRNGCCNSTKAYHPGKNFSEPDMKSLIDTCGMKNSCDTYPAPWTAGDSPANTSSLVEVKFYCKNENEDILPENEDDNPHTNPETLQDSDNTAAIVVPIVVVLMTIIIAGVVFVYWRRKKQRQTGKPTNTVNGVLNKAVHNDGYLQTDASNEQDTDPENTYNYIDLNSLPGESADDPGPQDDYNMIDPNKLDYETPANHDYFVLESETGCTTEAHKDNCIDTETDYNKMNHDYFVLESEAGGTVEAHNETDTEYNRINLESNEVVNDPSYHRLGSLEPSPTDKHGETDDSYSHIENGHKDEDNETRIIDEQAKHQQEVLNDDYSHLNS